MKNGVEYLIVKWTIGGSLLIVTMLFAGKIIVLMQAFIGTKLGGFLGYLQSPEVMKDIGSWVWQVITSSGK